MHNLQVWIFRLVGLSYPRAIVVRLGSAGGILWVESHISASYVPEILIYRGTAKIVLPRRQTFPNGMFALPAAASICWPAFQDGLAPMTPAAPRSPPAELRGFPKWLDEIPVAHTG